MAITLSPVVLPLPIAFDAARERREEILSIKSVKTVGTLAYNDASPVSLWTVPPDVLVLGLTVEVLVAFAGSSPVLSVGVSGATARHLATTDATVTAIGFTTVWRSHDYTAGNTIICTIGGTGLSAGTARFWLHYRQNSERGQG